MKTIPAAGPARRNARGRSGKAPVHRAAQGNLLPYPQSAREAEERGRENVIHRGEFPVGRISVKAMEEEVKRH